MEILLGQYRAKLNKVLRNNYSLLYEFDIESLYNEQGKSIS